MHNLALVLQWVVLFGIQVDIAVRSDKMQLNCKDKDNSFFKYFTAYGLGRSSR